MGWLGCVNARDIVTGLTVRTPWPKTFGRFKLRL